MRNYEEWVWFFFLVLLLTFVSILFISSSSTRRLFIVSVFGAIDGRISADSNIFRRIV